MSERQGQRLSMVNPWQLENKFLVQLISRPLPASHSLLAILKVPASQNRAFEATNRKRKIYEVCEKQIKIDGKQ